MRFWRFDHVWQNLESVTYAASIMGGRTNPSSSATYPFKVGCNHAGVAFAFWVIPILSIQISRAYAGSVSHELTLGEERSRAILKAFFKIVRCE
jgi:hypothetical protein